MVRLSRWTGVSSIVGGLAWAAACVNHNTQPPGCIGDCPGQPLRVTTTTTSVLFVVAVLMLAVSGVGLLMVTALVMSLANEQTSRILLAAPFGLAWLVAGVVLLTTSRAPRPGHTVAV